MRTVDAGTCECCEPGSSVGPVTVTACGLTFTVSRTLALTVTAHVSGGCPNWPVGAVGLFTFVGKFAFTSGVTTRTWWLWKMDEPNPPDTSDAACVPPSSIPCDDCCDLYWFVLLTTAGGVDTQVDTDFRFSGTLDPAVDPPIDLATCTNVDLGGGVQYVRHLHESHTGSFPCASFAGKDDLIPIPGVQFSIPAVGVDPADIWLCCVGFGNSGRGFTADLEEV